MNIYREKTDLYLKDTVVENLFISEYMVTADGDYVKLYLLAKMYAGSGEECSNAGLARELGLPLQKVMDAWNYWESRGLLRRIYSGREPGEFDLEFISPKQQMYGLEPTTAEDSLPEEEDIARLNAASWSQNALALFRSVESTLGRTLSSREMNDLQMWLEDWGMSPEVILRAYEVCIKERRKAPEIGYISAIVRAWYEHGLFREDSLEEYLAEHDRRHSQYRRIFKALGFIGRMPTEEERRIMNIWLDEYMLDLNTILEACKKTSGISSPNINYVNAILKDWKENEKLTPTGKKKLTSAQIDRIYQEIRDKNEALTASRREEIYGKFPRAKEIDSEIRILNSRLFSLVRAGKKETDEFRDGDARRRELYREKAQLLEDAGYPADYLNRIYSCEHCKDTGFLDNGEKCVCLVNRMMA